MIAHFNTLALHTIVGLEQDETLVRSLNSGKLSPFMYNRLKIAWLIGLVTLGVAELSSCSKLHDLTQNPELGPLEQGFKASAAIGYCASLATTAFTGGSLPANVSFDHSSTPEYSSSGVLHVRVTQSSPLPFNSSIGDIYIAGLWDGINGGVISIVFGDFDVVHAQFKFYGIYTVPISKNINTGIINAIFAEQDIVIGQGSDTLLNLGLSKPEFNSELLRLNNNNPPDVFAAVKQKVWFISIDQKNTPSDIYDDAFTLNGGGQIAEVKSNSGGVLYHALIETKFSYATCKLNPVSGTGFIQNVKASGSSVDLGNITLDFHGACDGRASVKFATGKYIGSNGQNVRLNWQ